MASGGGLIVYLAALKRGAMSYIGGYPRLLQLCMGNGTIKLPRSNVLEEIICGALALWGVRQRGLSETAGGFQTLSTIFFVYFNTGYSKILDLWLAKKWGGDDKIKIVLFEYFIAFISILQLKLF